MRRTHALAFSLLLAASPLAAQQAATDQNAPVQPEPARTEAPAATEPAPAPLTTTHRDKRLDVSPEQAREAMQASSDEHASAGPLSGHPWWWLVTAVAVGVIIAVVVAG